MIFSFLMVNGILMQDVKKGIMEANKKNKKNLILCFDSNF